MCLISWSLSHTPILEKTFSFCSSIIWIDFIFYSKKIEEKVPIRIIYYNSDASIQILDSERNKDKIYIERKETLSAKYPFIDQEDWRTLSKIQEMTLYEYLLKKIEIIDYIIKDHEAQIDINEAN